jgi:hypothetical protein
MVGRPELMGQVAEVPEAALSCNALRGQESAQSTYREAMVAMCSAAQSRRVLVVVALVDNTWSAL